VDTLKIPVQVFVSQIPVPVSFLPHTAGVFFADLAQTSPVASKVIDIIT
jgi:hypothetical protein